jgi:DNA-binding transcriptional LysR family regulator
MVVALSSGHRLSEREGGVRLMDLIHEPLLLYPKAPRPSFADQVLAAFNEANLTPDHVTEVRELQIAMGLVAAGEGISIVPESVQGMQHRNVAYRKIEDKHAFSPILFSVRHMDRSPELQDMLAAVYSIYDDLGIPHVKESL